MLFVQITEKGGERRRLEFDKNEIAIGRVAGAADVVLPRGNVLKRHARCVLRDGRRIIVDLKSTNGTYDIVNIRRAGDLEPEPRPMRMGMIMPYARE